MSRIGKKPIPIPKEVKIKQDGDLLTVTGPKGELKRKVHPMVKINTSNDQVIVSVDENDKRSKSDRKSVV